MSAAGTDVGAFSIFKMIKKNKNNAIRLRCVIGTKQTIDAAKPNESFNRNNDDNVFQTDVVVAGQLLCMGGCAITRAQRHHYISHGYTIK